LISATAKNMQRAAADGGAGERFHRQSECVMAFRVAIRTVGRFVNIKSGLHHASRSVSDK
jgi:hypothetical protein